MIHASNTDVCTGHGCVCIALPVPFDALAEVLQGASPKGWLIDSALVGLTGCIVYGPRDALDQARRALGVPEIGNASVDTGE